MKTIAVTGGKGGVGKTAMAAALSMALSRGGCRTMLFDADLALANVDVFLGLEPDRGLQHVVSGVNTLQEILVDGPCDVKVACGGSGIGALATAGPKRLGRLFEQVGAVQGDFDVCVFDTGAGVDRRVMAFLRQVDLVAVVLTPDPASLIDAYTTVKFLHRHRPDANVQAIVNMAASEEEAERAAAALKRVVDHYMKRQIPMLGWVRADPLAAGCVRSRTPLYVGAPASVMARDVEKIAGRVIQWLRPKKSGVEGHVTIAA